MEPAALQQLRAYLESLEERQVWSLLVEYFVYQGIQAAIVHGTGEHGMDVVAYVNQEKDFLRRGYNIIAQAKTGKLDLDTWRKDVLFQILEMPYYRIPHQDYVDHLPRRVVLVVTGEITYEARNSIEEFNKKHDVTIEAFELTDLIRLFDRTGFATCKLEQITGVGQPELISAEVSPPPVVGG